MTERLRWDPVPILLYHSIAGRTGRTSDPWQVRAVDFREDMHSVLATGRTPMTARHYEKWLTAPDASAIKPVLVTFDDGFADYADVALPILYGMGLTATLFVTSGWLGRPGMLSSSGLIDLALSTTEIGAHSVTHPHLDILSDGRARAEIANCREVLEDIVGLPVSAFAYPHGSYHGRTRKAVAESGYATAHAVKNALSHRHDDPFALGRFTVTAKTSRTRVRQVLACLGVPLAWHRERLRTRAYRVVRKFKAVGQEH
jgi:peptidoglycan/xylan/chitin deacetylase (PgdA/CDA1 family)